MAALSVLPIGGGLEFSRLKTLTDTTDGNLGAHIDVLARAAYVAIDKTFVGRRPRTTVHATALGRHAFAGHVAFLRKIIDEPAGTLP
jgi:hypothetical protein